MNREYDFVNKLGAETFKEFIEQYSNGALSSAKDGVDYREIVDAFAYKENIAKFCVFLINKLSEKSSLDGLGDLTEKEVNMIKNMRGVRSGNRKPAYKSEITPDIVRETVRKCGDKQKAAVELGCSIGTIYNRLREE